MKRRKEHLLWDWAVKVGIDLDPRGFIGHVRRCRVSGTIFTVMGEVRCFAEKEDEGLGLKSI